jgi:heat shock protein HtpX
MFSMNNFKTLVLMALMTGILLFVGQFFGGTGGLVIALIFVGIMNFAMYWWSDKIALAAMRSHEVTPQEEPELHAMVDRVVAAAGIPKPKVYISDNPSPNAFATGRNPEHAAIAVTTGIRSLLTPRELEAVIGHELGHVRNRDTLISTVAGTMAGVITFAARMAMFGAMFGGGGRDRGNAFAQLALILLAPIAAMLIQMAISRSREYQADKTGSEITRDPLALASALSKLEGGNKRLKEAGVLNEQSENPAMAHLFIVSPLAGGFAGLFSTHPPIEQRIERLQQIANDMGVGGYRTS